MHTILTEDIIRRVQVGNGLLPFFYPNKLLNKMKCSLLMAVGLCFAILACNNAPNYEGKQANDMADSTAVNYNGSSSAAVENTADTIHKFVRTADIKFKVGNVEKTTYQVEDIINSHGGFVTFTQLKSEADNVTTTAISKDSSIEKTSYTVTNSITFKVPNYRLDTTLKDIARLVDYLDYRVIKADDVSLQLYANSLAQKRSNQHANRLMQAVDKGSKKLNDITSAETDVEDIQTDRDQALINNVSLNEQVNYSTVQLALYQRQGTKTLIISNNKSVPEYEPPFGAKLWEALGSGMVMVETVFIGIMHIWPIILLAIAGVFTYKRYGKKI